jgi:hypothetical protein
MPRFVILHHEMPAGCDRASHWDFMLECGASLRTWALPSEPDSVDEQDAQQLADHRLAYLDYEGPVSGDRGEVRRWDSGTYRTIRDDSRVIEVELEGERLRGMIEFSALEDGQLWRFRIVRRLTRSTSTPLR